MAAGIETFAGPLARIGRTELLYPDTGVLPGGAEQQVAKPLELSLQVFNPDITGFNAQTIREARENQVMQGKVILALGAGPKGMAGAAARELILQGAFVVVSSRMTDSGEPKSSGMREFLEKLGPNAQWMGSNVAAWISVTNDRGKKVEMYDGQRLVRQVAKERGRLDGLIVGSGDMQNTWSYKKVEPEKVREILLKDAEGPMFAAITAAEIMQSQNPAGGKIAGIGGASGIGNAFQIEYSMAKGAFHAGIRALADELNILNQRALEKGRPPHNIEVNAIAPGLVDTPLVAGLSPEVRAGIVTKMGADRELDAGEPGAMLAYLMGPYSDGITGQVIPMFGRGEIPTWLAA